MDGSASAEHITTIHMRPSKRPLGIELAIVRQSLGGRGKLRPIDWPKGMFIPLGAMCGDSHDKLI